MGWNGSGVVVRTDGTRTGENVWQQARDAPVKILAAAADTHDQDLADAIEECLHLGGENSPTANIDWGGFKITNLAAGSARTDAATIVDLQGGAELWGGTSGGTANAQTLTLSPGFSTLTAGMTFRFIAGFTTTSTTVTLTVSGATKHANVQAFGSHELAPTPITLSATKHSNVQAFGTHAVPRTFS